MNAWEILSIFENLPKVKSPTLDSLAALADCANKDTPSDVWGLLRNWSTHQYIDDMKHWLHSLFVRFNNDDEINAVYFLLFDTEFGNELEGQDLYVYPAESSFDEETYEMWDRPEPIERSKNSAFEWIAENIEAFLNINGFSDYAIPLLFSGAAIFETMKNLCDSNELHLDRDISFGVGYTYGDAFNLGTIVNGKLSPNIDRIA